MSSAWDKALFARAPVVFGRQLLPLSLAHVRALKAMASPYVGGGAASPVDALIAASICSRTLAQINAEVFGAAVQPWRRWWGARWLMRWRADAFRAGHSALVEYFDEFAAQPPHEWATGETRQYAAPWEYHTARVLCKVYGMSVAQAWECPVGLARCLYDTHAEAEGDETLITDQLAKGYEMIAEANRLVEAGRNDEANKLYEEAAPLVRKT